MAEIKYLANLNLSKNQLLNATIQNLAVAPSSPAAGQIYWSTADDTLYAYNEADSEWMDLGSDGITNLGYTAAVSQGTVTSNTGTNATIPLADGTNAGLFSAAEKTKLSNIEANAKDDQNASEVSSSASGNLSATNVQAALQELQGDIDTLDAETNNLSITQNVGDVDVAIENGTDITIGAASTSQAGVMTKAMFDKLDGIEAGAQTETLTSLGLAANILTYTDEDGTETDLDLSLYLDDTNLARLTSGSLNSTTGVATFTRDDATTFTIDMSAFLDAITLNNTLTSTSTTEGLTAAQGKVLKDLIDGLNTSYVDLTTAQSVGGIKTFTDDIYIDSADNTISIDGDDKLVIYGDSALKLESGDGVSMELLDTVAITGTSEIALGNGTIDMSSLTGEKHFAFPDTSGTVALTSDFSGTNTGDEVAATTTVSGIVELATQAEVNAGTDTTRAITPSRLKSTLGITATLSTTLTYSELIGNGTLTSIVVTHDIGNQFVQAQVYEVAGMDKVECEIELTSSTTTTFKFNVAPAANALRVVIIG
jgi:hypothetical protein